MGSFLSSFGQVAVSSLTGLVGHELFGLPAAIGYGPEPATCDASRRLEEVVEALERQLDKTHHRRGVVPRGEFEKEVLPDEGGAAWRSLAPPVGCDEAAAAAKEERPVRADRSDEGGHCLHVGSSSGASLVAIASLGGDSRTRPSSVGRAAAVVSRGVQSGGKPAKATAKARRLAQATSAGELRLTSVRQQQPQAASKQSQQRQHRQTTGKSCALAGSAAPTAATAAAVVARSAARCPCRCYYCSSSLRANAGDDRASAPPSSNRMLANVVSNAKTITKIITKQEIICQNNTESSDNIQAAPNKQHQHQISDTNTNTNITSNTHNLKRHHQNQQQDQQQQQHTLLTTSIKSTKLSIVRRQLKAQDSLDQDEHACDQNVVNLNDNNNNDHHHHHHLERQQQHLQELVLDCCCSSFELQLLKQQHQLEKHNSTSLESEPNPKLNKQINSKSSNLKRQLSLHTDLDCPPEQLQAIKTLRPPPGLPPPPGLQKFVFVEGVQDCVAREHRSLSTCSTLTSESNGDSLASSGYSSPSPANSSPSPGHSDELVPTNPALMVAQAGSASTMTLGAGSSQAARRRCSGSNNNNNRKHQNNLDVVMEPERPRPIDIQMRQAQFASKSASSSLDSGRSSSSGSHLDLTSSGLVTTGAHLLHPTVSALLKSTANLTLTKHQPVVVVDVDTPPPSPMKRSKKTQSSNSNQANHSTTANYREQSLSTLSSSSSNSSSPCSPSSLSGYFIENSKIIQDATYLKSPTGQPIDHRQLSGDQLVQQHQFAEPPPRPWLSPSQQLQYLSKGKLKLLFTAGRIDEDQLKQLLEARSRSCANKQKQNQQQQMPPLKQLGAFNATRNNMSLSSSSPIASNLKNEFTVLSYNVLSDRMVNTERFPSSPDQALNWLYRRELILRQLLDHGADVVALQELEMEQYESFFKPKLESLGNYCGLFESKSRARTMDLQMRRRVDGCAIFYKRDKFRLIGKHLLEFNQIAMANARGSEAMLNRVMTKDNIGLVAVFELIGTNNPADVNDDEIYLDYSPELLLESRGKRLIVCNTHIHWNPDCCDVKLIQTIMLMNELRHIAHHYSPRKLDTNQQQQQLTQPGAVSDDLKSNPLIPLVLLGDFNSLHKSGVVQYLLGGSIDSSHKDFREYKYTQCSNALALRYQSGQNHQQRPSDGDLVARRASQQPQLPPEKGYSRIITTDRLLSGLGLTSSLSPLARRQSSPITGATTNSASPATPPPEPCSMTPPAPPVAPINNNPGPDELLFYEHPFKLASAYECGVMPFTNYTTQFKATIDYIFYAQDQLELLGSLGPLDANWLKQSKLKGFPQMQFPSDHLPLVARFKLLTIADDMNYDSLSSNSSPIVAGLPLKRTSAVPKRLMDSMMTPQESFSQQQHQRRQHFYVMNTNKPGMIETRKQQRQLYDTTPKMAPSNKDGQELSWHQLKREQAEIEATQGYQPQTSFHHFHRHHHHHYHHHHQLHQRQQQQQQQTQVRKQLYKQRRPCKKLLRQSPILIKLNEDWS